MGNKYYTFGGSTFDPLIIDGVTPYKINGASASKKGYLGSGGIMNSTSITYPSEYVLPNTNLDMMGDGIPSGTALSSLKINDFSENYKYKGQSIYPANSLYCELINNGSTLIANNKYSDVIWISVYTGKLFSNLIYSFTDVTGQIYEAPNGYHISYLYNYSSLESGNIFNYIYKGNKKTSIFELDLLTYFKDTSHWTSISSGYSKTLASADSAGIFEGLAILAVSNDYYNKYIKSTTSLSNVAQILGVDGTSNRYTLTFNNLNDYIFQMMHSSETLSQYGFNTTLNSSEYFFTIQNLLKVNQ